MINRVIKKQMDKSNGKVKIVKVHKNLTNLSKLDNEINYYVNRNNYMEYKSMLLAGGVNK